MPIVRHHPIVKVGIDRSFLALNEDPGGRTVMIPVVAYLRGRLGRGLVPILQSDGLEGVMLIEDYQGGVRRAVLRLPGGVTSTHEISLRLLYRFLVCRGFFHGWRGSSVMLVRGGALGRDRCKCHRMIRAHDPIKVLFLVALGFPEPADVLFLFLDEGLAVLLQEIIDCLFVHRLVDLLVPVRGDPTRIDSWYLELGQRLHRLRIVVLILIFDHHSCF